MSNKEALKESLTSCADNDQIFISITCRNKPFECWVEFLDLIKIIKEIKNER